MRTSKFAHFFLNIFIHRFAQCCLVRDEPDRNIHGRPGKEAQNLVMFAAYFSYQSF